VLLALDVPDTLFEQYEWIEEEKHFRESLIPAESLNQYGPPNVVIDSDRPM
jgi:hypothetical protein